MQAALEFALLGSGAPVVEAWVVPLELSTVEPVGSELDKVLPVVDDPVLLVELAEVLNVELAEVLNDVGVVGV